MWLRKVAATNTIESQILIKNNPNLIQKTALKRIKTAKFRPKFDLFCQISTINI